MKGLSGWVHRQSERLLQNRQYATFCAAVLACIPYTVWLSVAIVALIVLRKGAMNAVQVFGVAMMMHGAFLLLSVSPEVAVVSTLLTFVPCFIAANVLRLTSSWQGVAVAYQLLIVLVMLGLQWFMPEMAMMQYQRFQLAIRQLSQDSPLWTLLNSQNGLNELLLANYMLGVQAAGVALSSTLSLMLARSLQSQLYYPGGFRQEALQFRGHRVAVLILVAMWLAASRGNLLATNLLPGILIYFLFTGISLSLNLFMHKRSVAPILTLGLIVSIVLLPFILLPIFVILGVLDSLFNLRVYLPANAGNRT